MKTSILINERQCLIEVDSKIANLIIEMNRF